MCFRALKNYEQMRTSGSNLRRRFDSEMEELIRCSGDDHHFPSGFIESTRYYNIV